MGPSIMDLLDHELAQVRTDVYFSLQKILDYELLDFAE